MIITHSSSSDSRSGSWRKILRISSASKLISLLDHFWSPISDQCIQRPPRQTLWRPLWSHCQGPSPASSWCKQITKSQQQHNHSNLHMRTQNSSHSTASLPSTSTWSYITLSTLMISAPSVSSHLINGILQLRLGGVLSQRSHHLGELLINKCWHERWQCCSSHVTFVLMLPSPFLSNWLKAERNTVSSSWVMLARMARLSSSVTALIRPLHNLWHMIEGGSVATCYCYGKEF